MTSLYEWREKGRHLPPFMRDFHAQKRVFKWLDRAAQHQNAQNPKYAHHPNFQKAMVYTVDIFLWIMAAHGYTLQRTRAKVDDLGDLDEALAAFDVWWQARCREEMDRAFRSTPAPDGDA